MKIFLFLSIITFLFFSCQEKRNDVVITKEFCGELLKDIDLCVTSVEMAVKRSGERKLDVEVLESSKRIASWKKPYFKNEKEESLFQYADSLIHYYKINGLQDVVIKEVFKSREIFSKTKDSIDHYQLLFWTLKTEAHLQHSNAGKVGADVIRCYFGGLIPSEINAEQIQLGDSIYLTFKLGDDKYTEVKYNLDSLYLENQDTKVRTKLKAVKVETQYILHMKPQERGSFHIFGKIGVNFPDGFSRSARIAKEFKVI